MGATITSLVFQPPVPSYHYSDRYFFIETAAKNRIAAFFIEHKNAEYTILFSHGNAEDIGLIYDWLYEISLRLRVGDVYGPNPNANKLIVTAEGIASEEACYMDIEAAFAYLQNVKMIAPQHILLYGRSLGSGPTTYLAAKQSRRCQSVAGVILQSPVLSMYRVVFHFRFSMPGDMFCNVDRMHEIETPITIIHGTQDEVVPFWHAETLFEKCRQEWRTRPLWVTDAGHNNIEFLLSMDGDILIQHLSSFRQLCHETLMIRMHDNVSIQHEQDRTDSSSSVVKLIFS